MTATATGSPIANVTVIVSTSSGGTEPDGGLGGTAITAADGTFEVDGLPYGDMVVTFSRAGYVQKTVQFGITYGSITNLSVSLGTDATSADGMSVAVTDNLHAGFGASVALTAVATAPDSADGGTLTYSWTQTGGTPAVLTGANTSTLHFTTLSLASAKLEANPKAALGPYDGGGFVPARFGPMGIGIDETGNYEFTVKVTDPAGHSVTTTAIVWATAPTTGLLNVPPGVPVWFEGDTYAADGGLRTTWNFTLQAPAGSTATLTGANTQFPSFTPDLGFRDSATGYVITDTVTGSTATVYASNWTGLPAATSIGTPTSCGTCHNGPVQFPSTPYGPSGSFANAANMFPAWETTKHSRALSDGLDGVLGSFFGPSCLQCHTLGDSPVPLGNNGFADVALDAGWTFPATLDAGNYAALVESYPTVASLANVQCENCHGPRNLFVMTQAKETAKSFREDVCAQCHSQADQWKQSLHANLQVAINEAVGSANCARCHSAQGFTMYAEELNAGCIAAGSSNCLITSDGNPPADGGANAADGGTLAAIGLTAAAVEPETCTACHDPHNVAGFPGQLRVYDSVANTLMNGVAISGVGAGATCMVCHNSRPSFAEVDDNTITTNGLTSASTIITPHNGTQTDVLYGANAYFMPRDTPSPHLAITDTCVGCHYAIPTASQQAAGLTSNHTFITDTTICSTCHAKVFDGAQIQSQTATQLGNLDQAIFTAFNTVLGASLTSFSDFNTTVRDPVTFNYLCVTGSGTPNVYLPINELPATYAPFTGSAGPPVHTTPWRNLGSVLVTFTTNPFTGMSGLAECNGTNSPVVVPGATYSGGPVVISISAAQAGSTHASANPPLVSAVSITGKAIYNEALVNNDLSLGVHNYSFTQTLIANTLAQLANVTSSNP